VKSIEPGFNKATVEGRLGQAHADLVDCVMCYSMENRIHNGKLEIIIDPHKLRMAMGGGKQYSAEQIEVLENDLLKAILTMHTKIFNKVRTHIVDRIIDSYKTKLNPLNATQRKLRCWIFTEEWTKLILNDVAKYYDPKPLCRIEYGSVAAIARHVLTHQFQPNGGWKLEGLIEAAGVKRQASKVKNELTESADELANLGIKIVNDRIFLSRTRPKACRSRPKKQKI
jgi:hypothetical protein